MLRLGSRVVLCNGICPRNFIKVLYKQGLRAGNRVQTEYQLLQDTLLAAWWWHHQCWWWVYHFYLPGTAVREGGQFAPFSLKCGIKGKILFPKSYTDSEPEAPLVKEVLRLDPHLAQRLETSRSIQAELSAAGWFGAGWRGQRSGSRAVSPPCPHAFSCLIHAGQQ